MNMKKNLIPCLSAAFTVGMALVFVFSRLADKNDLFYIAATAAAVIAALSIFFVSRKTSEQRLEERVKTEELINSLLEKNNGLENSLTKYISAQDKTNAMLAKFCGKTDKSVEQLKEIQANIIDENRDYIEKLSHHIDSMTDKLKATYTDANKKQCRENAEQLSKLAELCSACIGDLGDTVSNRITEVSSMFSKQMDLSGKELSAQRTEAAKSLEELIENTDKSVSKLLNNSYDSLKNIQRQCDKTLQMRLDETNKLVSSFNTMAENKLTDMNAEYHEMLTAFQNDIEEMYLNLCESINDIFKKSSDAVNAHNKELSVTFAGIMEKQSESLKTHNTKAIDIASNRLAESTKNTISQQTTHLQNFVNEFTKENTDIMNSCSKTLSQKTNESITNFINSTENIFAKNASMTEELLNTERGFIEDYDKQNTGINRLIADCFKQYDEKIASLTDGFERKVAGFIGEENELSKQHFENLETAMLKYSDGFAEKSAEAVAMQWAELQKDNSAELKEMRDSISKLTETTNTFTLHSRENNNKTAHAIDMMIAQNRGFIDDMRTVNSESIDRVNGSLDTHLDRLKNEFSELNKENSKTFSSSMDDYRERFVDASAEAIAKVQKDNVDAITSAHNKLSELANMVQEVKSGYTMLAVSLNDTINKMKDAIEMGNKKAEDYYEEQQNNLNDGITEISKDVKRIFEDKLEEYNVVLKQTLDTISGLENAVKNNTSSYQQTLRAITDSRNKLNELTNKDVKLLESLVKR